ncbi:hypothetical protein AVEN_120014-1 [Araneus ventricosus]|uniref:Uncharacterized protein n=1 Tax=Araneus ventricosus TaxID=182803 RepID=A0A4Y2C973_ARAVE|nr:hypothetical protein AVEN_120014-1 [Araneus ventricosus]
MQSFKQFMVEHVYVWKIHEREIVLPKDTSLTLAGSVPTRNLSRTGFLGCGETPAESANATRASMCTTTLIQGSPCALLPMDRWTTYRKQGEMYEINHVSAPGARHAIPSTCTHPTDLGSELGFIQWR